MWMHEKKPVRFDLIDHIPNGSTVIAKLIIDDIDHPNYGKMDGVKVDIPLILPKGVTPQSNFFGMSFNEQDELVGKLGQNLQEVYETMTTEELKSRVLGWTILNALGIPTVDVRCKLFADYVELTAAAFGADDIVDSDDGIAQEIKSKFFFQKYEAWEEIWTHGKYDKLNELAEHIPLIQPWVQLLISALKDIDQVMGRYGHLKSFSKSIFLTAQTIPLNYTSKRSKNFSEEGLRMLRATNAGAEAAIASKFISEDYKIPSKVNESVLFKLFLECLNMTCGLLNDIFGIEKDIKKDETDGNVILRQVMYGSLTLEDALNLEVKRLENLVADIRLASEDLIETFADVANFKEYIVKCQEVYDSQVYAYALGAKWQIRYGSSKIQFVTI